MLERAPIVLPHFVRRGREVFFLASRRPCLVLGEDEVASFDAPELASDARIAEWRRRGIVVSIPRVAVPEGAPHVVVVEPHMDDAALSIGGILARRRGRRRITIVSVVRDSDFTSYTMAGRADFEDVAAVTAIRSKEAAIAARMLGGEARTIGETDALLRFRRSQPRAEPLEASMRAWMRFGPTDAEVDRLADALASIVRGLEPAELWAPLGAGGHVDHVRTREACLRLVARGQATAPRVYFYADVPHVARYPDQPEQIARAVAAAGAELRRATEDVAEVFDEKLELASVYASQFKRSWIERVLAEQAEAAAGTAGGRAEVFYELVGAPRSLPPLRATSTRPAHVEDARAQLLAWREAARDVRRIVVAGPAPLGDPERLVACLAARFPDADVAIAGDERAADAEDAHVVWVGEGRERNARRVVVASAGDVVLALG